MLDSKLCPLCKKPNLCSVDKIESCWCIKTKIPSKLLELVPKKLKNKACICKSCVEEFRKNEEKFLEKYS